MSIALSPHIERIMEEKLGSGQYRSADDLLLAAFDALEALSSRPLTESTLAAIDRAEDEIDQGKVVDWATVRDDLRARFQGN